MVRRVALFLALASGTNALAPSMKLQAPSSRREFGSFLPRAAAAVATSSFVATAGVTVSPDAALAAATVDSKAIKVTERGVKYVTTKAGGCPTADVLGALGSCRPAKGSFCIIDFTGFLPSGEVFDSTEKKGGKPLAFKLGARQVIAGFEEVVAEMLPGEEVQAFIPAALAYGTKGVCTAPGDDGTVAPPPAAADGAAADGATAEGPPPAAAGECLIPPNTNLKYFIRLKTVSSPPP